MTDPDILIERRGAAGLVTLNRPRALNAVTLGMVRALRDALDRWRDDPAVTRVVIAGAGGRAFSAGGDLRQMYDLCRAGRHAEALVYWREEYALNRIIKYYPKPYVALIDGITMGGGAGLSVHGSHRVAGDRLQFAMPEVAIGFFPDVGATFFLPRLPGELGAWCAVTGERLGPDDALAAGIATHRVASGRFADLLDGFADGAPVDAVLAAVGQPAGEGPLAPHRAAIDRLFAGDAAGAILDALDRDGSAFAATAAKTMRSRSPTSVALALAQVRRGGGLSFDDCLRLEFRIVSRLVHGHDFYEGVRAVLIDKDNAPRWRPATLAGVADAEIERHFAPLPEAEEWRPT